MITIKSHGEIMRMIDAGKVLQEVFALLHEKISPGIIQLSTAIRTRSAAWLLSDKNYFATPTIE
jgi:methionine aminopeptidase